MFLLEWTASDLLMMALAASVMIGTVLWLVPSARVPRKRYYTPAELTAYDAQIPRYFLAAALALLIGGTHTVIKNLPGFWLWLWTAGYGGHLFRDLSNSHIIIVGGGTVLLTGITWYVLPRFVNRPLYSEALAGASLWFTVIGVFGFYLSWLILGLVEGHMVANGWDYMAAKEAVGAWHRVPTRLTSSIMGVGYWTYVLNVLLTVWAGRHVAKQPLGHLTKFALVSALALFVGTVQGVLQVLPANADWIHYAGKFGQYVDPISHAHINLVTGMMVSLAGFFIYFSNQLGGKWIDRSQANRLFWVLVPGSLLFYLTFLGLGLVLGNAVNGYGGLYIPEAVPFFSQRRALLLAVSGTAMLAGFWLYFVTLWRALDLRTLLYRVRRGEPAAFWLASTVALVVGTTHGLLQVIPATSLYLTTPEELPNIHAQLNMVGGVLLALIGLVYLLLPQLVGQAIEQRLARLSLIGIGSGIAGYYVVTVAAGLARYGYMRQGLDTVQSAAHLGWVAPVLLTITSVPMLLGYGAFALAVFRATRAYRQAMVAEWRLAPARFSGPMPARLQRIPLFQVLGMEFIGGCAGWPGLGWLYAGQALPGVALLLLGPAIAWALLPMLFSPFTETALSQWGWVVLLVWLPASSLLSAALLALFIRRSRRHSRATAGGHSPAPMNPVLQPAMATQAAAVGRARIPRSMLLGVLLLLGVLVSIPLTPLLMGIPETVTAQSLMHKLPDRADGAYLALENGADAGLMKLMPWSFALDEFPDSAPMLNPSYLRAIHIRQKGLDAAERYQLFRLDTEEPVPLQTEVVAFQRELLLQPAAPLPLGAYLLTIPTGGMFAGRQYYYFGLSNLVTTFPPVVPEATDPAMLSVAASSNSSTASSPWLTLLPLSSALISGLAALVMARRLRQKVRPHEAVWTVAFALFAVAAAVQVVGDRGGWTANLARLYYVSGATLVVGWLGLGTWLLLVRRLWLQNLGLWLMILVSGYAIGLASMAPVDSAQLLQSGWRALEKPLALTILTILLNSIGTLVLVGGALWSAWLFWRKGVMRQRMLGCLLLAAGALIVATGGSLTRLGHDEYLYIAMSVGVAIMFWGYLKTIRPAVMHTNASPVARPSPEAQLQGQPA